MSTEGYIPPCLNAAELRKLVQDALANAPGAGNLETYHARFDHLERGISMDDVIHGLESDWELEGDPVFNRSEWQWKYRIRTETVDGDELTIVIAVDTTHRSLEVLTRWKPTS